jgi:uncharacterized protein YqeY
MTKLREKIEEDLKKAMKEKKEREVLALRLLRAALFNREKEKRYKISKGKKEIKEEELAKESQLTDDEIREVIFSEIKKRKEAISEFIRGKREDLVQKEEKEMEVLKKYLPEELPQEEIEKMAKEIIEKIGAKEMKDMGKVMKELMPKVKGRAEGKTVSEIVQGLLSKK